MPAKTLTILRAGIRQRPAQSKLLPAQEKLFMLPVILNMMLLWMNYTIRGSILNF
jgi:hypothetical protein